MITRWLRFSRSRNGLKVKERRSRPGLELLEPRLAASGLGRWQHESRFFRTFLVDKPDFSL
jgi:hypothetical protein